MRKFLLLAATFMSVMSAVAQEKHPISEPPEGEQCEYFFVRGENVDSVTSRTNLSLSKISMEKCVATADGELYFPAFLATGIVPDTMWLKGSLSADGAQFTVENDQPLGIYDGHEYYFNLGDFDLVYDYYLTFNLKQDPVFGTENCFYVQEKIDTLYIPLQSLYAVSIYRADDESVFNKPVERRLTAKIRTADGVKEVESTVIDYESPRLGGHFMKGVMPYYPEIWVFMPYSENGGIFADCNKVDRSTMIYVTDGITNPNESDLTAEINNRCEFKLNADGSYTMADGLYWSNLYYDNEKDMFMTDMACYDITIGAPLTTDVTEVETAAKPVEARYYDLSGRSISANTNGVNIRVDKYADGTCRTVKSVR